MSKSSELRMMKYGLRIDAPVNFHHRTGDSDEGGSMLDFYARSESAEEIYFGNADELAREKFIKGFQVYLKKVFSAQEREFLKRLLAGKESAYKIGRSLGVEHFAFLQSIQLKAYKNVKPLAKLAKMTGWSGAESFTETIFKRLEQLNAGFSINEIIPQNRKIEKFRKKKNTIMRYWRSRNYEHWKAYAYAYMAKWREENREHLRELYRAYYAKNREKERERKKKQRQKPEYLARERARQARYKAEHAEEIRERDREYFAKNREAINEKHRTFYDKNKERINAKRNAPEKREKRLAYLREYSKAHREQERTYRRARYAEVKERLQEQSRRWRENNPERAKEIQQAALKRYRAKKKAEREEAKKAVVAQVSV